MSRKTTAWIITAAFVGGFVALAQSDSRVFASDHEKHDSHVKSTMTVVGCLVKEKDYRRANELGKGHLGGAGLGDEFVLVNTTMVASEAEAASARASCTESSGRPAYRVTGKTEEQLKPFVGQRMEITGKWNDKDDARIAAGTKHAKLPAEIKMASFREAPVPVREAAVIPEAAPAPIPAPEAPSVEAPAEPAPAPSAPVAEIPAPTALPKTASAEPLIALVGLFLMAAGFGVQLVRRRIA